MRLSLAASFVVAFLSGCAIGQRTSYSGEYRFQPTPMAIHRPIVLAVQDNRPSVLSGSDSEARVGTLRAIAGVPWEVKTESGAPLADDFGQSISKTLNVHQYNSVYMAVLPTDSPADVLAKAKTIQPDGVLLHLIVTNWWQHTWLATNLDYCVSARVTGLMRDCEGNASQCGEKDLSSGNPGFDDLATALGTIFGSIINDPSIGKCLGGTGTSLAASSSVPPTSQTIQIQCSTEKVLRLKKAGVSDLEIKEFCEGG